jgi:hypothetical protein
VHIQKEEGHDYKKETEVCASFIATTDHVLATLFHPGYTPPFCFLGTFVAIISCCRPMAVASSFYFPFGLEIVLDS